MTATDKKPTRTRTPKSPAEKLGPALSDMLGRGELDRFAADLRATYPGVADALAVALAR